MEFKVEIEVPMVPNYLRLSDGAQIKVGQLTDPQLQALGAEWTQRLIKRAAEQRREDA